MTAAWLTDWASYAEAARELTQSGSALMRALGFTALSVSTPFADAEGSQAQIDRARLDLAAGRAASNDSLCEVIAGLIRWVEGRVAAGRGDFQAGLQGSIAFLTVCRAIDFYPTPTPRAAKHAAICQILLGDPAAAIDTVAWLEDLHAAAVNADDILALALLAEDRLTDATTVVHAHATRGLSGRMPGQVSDSVLLFAALTEAEGDSERARHLLEHMGAGLEPGIIIFSRHLANRLGIGTEHAERQRRALTYRASDTEGFNGTRMASDAVRSELARRGWD